MEYEAEIESIPEYATYADGIGPWIKLLNDQKLMQLAKEYDLAVHAYTLRKDQLDGNKSFDDLLNDVLYKSDVDGVFTDHPDVVLDYLKKK